MSRRFNPPSESVFWPMIRSRLRHLPMWTVNQLRHKRHDAYMRIWNIVKIQIPYWLSKRGR